MKKIIFITIFTLFGAGLYSQNNYKYQVSAFGGLSVGGNYSTKVTKGKIDSIVVSAGGITFWSGGIQLDPGGGAMVFPGSGIPFSTGSSWGPSIADNSTNWNSAYTDRLKWDGGATGLVAATGRTSLGGTTVGQALFTLTNPSAITFPRINANNTITTQSATDFKTSLSLNNVTNESKTTMFTSPVFTGNVPTTGGVPTSRVYSDTMKVSAGVLRTKATTITTEPYGIMILDSSGNDITHSVKDSVALNGGVYKLYVYSVDELTGCKLKILY